MYKLEGYKNLIRENKEELNNTLYYSNALY
jgi:hypothetical protein